MKKATATKGFPRLAKKATKKEGFTAAELIADLRFSVDGLEQRLAALEKKRP